jgi:hypothetical protein
MKSLPIASFVALIALSGCGNDSAPRPNAASEVSPSAAKPPATEAAASIAREAKLTSSPPVSTDGAISLNKDCNVEGVDGALFTAEGLTIQGKGTHEISGWVVDAKNRVIPQDLKLIVAGVGSTAGVWTNQAPMWIERKGVAETRGYGPELNNSGFAFKVDTSILPAGSYHVYVMSPGKTGLLVCDPGRQLNIAP